MSLNRRICNNRGNVPGQKESIGKETIFPRTLKIIPVILEAMENRFAEIKAASCKFNVLLRLIRSSSRTI